AADLVPLAHCLPGGRLCGGDGTGTDHLQERVFNGIVDPQATEGDAARFAVLIFPKSAEVKFPTTAVAAISRFQ
ncbi:hypothetical protein, partial [Thioclava sp. JE_KL1]|uniref:hypothetical protein n=1 Tax=Thioclava sp. JE_KL1 TaxID=2651187 RepID=UPI001562E567